MPPQAIRMLPFGISLILLRAAPPIIADLRTWTARPDATQLATDRTEVEALLQTTARRARRGSADADQSSLPDGELTAQRPASSQDVAASGTPQIPLDQPEEKEHS